MDVIIVAAIVIAVLVVAIIFFARASRAQARKKKDDLLLSLTRTANSYGLQLTEHEINKDALGIDEINNKMIFIQYKEKEPDVHVIDLANVKEARVVKHVQKQAGERDEHINSIALEILFRTNAVAPLSIFF
jgi:hypothetical protein